MLNKRKKAIFLSKKAYKLSKLKMLSLTEITFIIYCTFGIPLIFLIGTFLENLISVLCILNIMLFISIFLSVYDNYKINKSKFNNSHKIYFISSLGIQIAFYLGLWMVILTETIISSIFILVGFFFYLINVTYFVRWIGNYLFYLFLKSNYPLELKRFEEKGSLSKTRLSRYMPIQDQIALYTIKKFNGILGRILFLYVYSFIMAKLYKTIDTTFIHDLLSKLFNGILMEFGIFLAIVSVVLSISTITVPLAIKIENKAYKLYENSRIKEGF